MSVNLILFFIDVVVISVLVICFMAILSIELGCLVQSKTIYSIRGSLNIYKLKVHNWQVWTLMILDIAFIFFLKQL